MKPILEREMQEYIGEQELFSEKHGLLIGVSGGIDSVVLCHLLKSLGYHFEIAHLNFQLRGEESTRDEEFVLNLAALIQVKLHIKRTDTVRFAEENKLSIQMAARQLRYQWFGEILDESAASQNALQYILTAHHANDNAETILMNVFRGAGMAGLRGILPARDKIRRPLLFASREQIRFYAEQNNLNWVEDSSNSVDKYARNYIRNAVMPVIQSQYPALVQTLNESAIHMRESELFLNAAIASQLKKMLKTFGQESQLPINAWSKLPGSGAILFAWLKPFGFSAAQLPDAISLSKSQTGRFVDSGSHRLLRNRDWLIITPLETRASAHVLLDSDKGEHSFATGQLIWKTVTYSGENIPAESATAWLDAQLVGYPLLLRPWKPGDYFYPLGMRKKKKVARFLIDSKIPRHEKDRVWVLESAGRIIWVVGLRVDDRYKLRPGTSRMLQLQFNSAL